MHSSVEASDHYTLSLTVSFSSMIVSYAKPQMELVFAGLVANKIGLDAAAALIDPELMFKEEICTSTPKEFLPCHPQHRL